MVSTTVDPTVVVLEVLNQFSNYDRWSLAVKNYLLAEDVWDVVEDTKEPPKEGESEFKTWRKNNAKALRTIQNCCGTYHSNFISKTNSAKDAWDTLARLFEPVFFEITGEVSSDVAIHDNTKCLTDGPLFKRDEIRDLEDTHVDPGDWNTFYRAVFMDKIEMAKDMVEKNKKILTIGFPSQGLLPVLWAYTNDQFKMARYLYQHTPLNALKSRDGAELISQSFSKKEVDIAWNLIHRCPSLAVATDYFGHSPLNALAGLRCAFLSGRPLKLWEQWIYDSIHIEPTLTHSGNIPPPAINDIRINVQREENNEDNHRDINRPGMGFLGQLATSLLKRWLSGHYNRIYEMKLMHDQSLAFLQFMCEATKNINLLNDMQCRFVQSAIFKAVERGHIEFITHILKANPSYAVMTDAQGMNMFQFAVECRQEKVYNLIYGLNPRDRRILMKGTVDNLNNSTLHLVGRLTPYTQLDHIQDAALRMQREVQWFKKVERIVPKNHADLMNFTDNMTPHELFKKNHKELKTEGENSMKGTATSCTVVGALIVTMMFAAAFQVPGGNNGETGIPVLIHKMQRNWFLPIIVADAISLCLSTSSVIIFLGILTSRYEEDDFLESLPKKMILGLATLFISITTMMIAFSSAIYIMLEEKSLTGILVILLGGIPVTTFVLMQFRLLKEMVISTYGAGIFQRKVEAWPAGRSLYDIGIID